MITIYYPDDDNHYDYDGFFTVHSQSQETCYMNTSKCRCDVGDASFFFMV